MGGKTWREEEESFFWKTVLPISPEGSDPAKRQKTWNECAEMMRCKLGHLGYRSYNKQLLYEHWYQNCRSVRPSPRARAYVKAYMEQRGDDPIIPSHEVQPSRPRRTRQKTTAARSTATSNKMQMNSSPTSAPTSIPSTSASRQLRQDNSDTALNHTGGQAGSGMMPHGYDGYSPPLARNYSVHVSPYVSNLPVRHHLHPPPSTTIATRQTEPAGYEGHMHMPLLLIPNRGFTSSPSGSPERNDGAGNVWSDVARCDVTSTPASSVGQPSRRPSVHTTPSPQTAAKRSVHAAAGGRSLC